MWATSPTSEGGSNMPERQGTPPNTPAGAPATVDHSEDSRPNATSSQSSSKAVDSSPSTKPASSFVAAQKALYGNVGSAPSPKLDLGFTAGPSILSAGSSPWGSFVKRGSGVPASSSSQGTPTSATTPSTSTYPPALPPAVPKANPVKQLDIDSLREKLDDLIDTKPRPDRRHTTPGNRERVKEDASESELDSVVQGGSTESQEFEGINDVQTPYSAPPDFPQIPSFGSESLPPPRTAAAASNNATPPSMSENPSLGNALAALDSMRYSIMGDVGLDLANLPTERRESYSTQVQPQIVDDDPDGERAILEVTSKLRDILATGTVSSSEAVRRISLAAQALSPSLQTPSGDTVKSKRISVAAQVIQKIATNAALASNSPPKSKTPGSSKVDALEDLLSELDDAIKEMDDMPRRSNQLQQKPSGSLPPPPQGPPPGIPPQAFLQMGPPPPPPTNPPHFPGQYDPNQLPTPKQTPTRDIFPTRPSGIPPSYGAPFSPLPPTPGASYDPQHPAPTTPPTKSPTPSAASLTSSAFGVTSPASLNSSGFGYTRLQGAPTGSMGTGFSAAAALAAAQFRLDEEDGSEAGVDIDSLANAAAPPGVREDSEFDTASRRSATSARSGEAGISKKLLERLGASENEINNSSMKARKTLGLDDGEGKKSNGGAGANGLSGEVTIGGLGLDKLIYQGFLGVQVGLFKNFKKYFCVLVEGRLYYFKKNDPHEKALGDIPVTGDRISSKIAQGKFLIEVQSTVSQPPSRISTLNPGIPSSTAGTGPRRTFTLLTEDEDDMKNWTRMLKRAIPGTPPIRATKKNRGNQRAAADPLASLDEDDDEYKDLEGDVGSTMSGPVPGPMSPVSPQTLAMRSKSAPSSPGVYQGPPPTMEPGMDPSMKSEAVFGNAGLIMGRQAGMVRQNSYGSQDGRIPQGIPQGAQGMRRPSNEYQSGTMSGGGAGYGPQSVNMQVPQQQQQLPQVQSLQQHAQQPQQSLLREQQQQQQFQQYQQQQQMQSLQREQQQQQFQQYQQYQQPQQTQQQHSQQVQMHAMQQQQQQQLQQQLQQARLYQQQQQNVQQPGYAGAVMTNTSIGVMPQLYGSTNHSRSKSFDGDRSSMIWANSNSPASTPSSNTTYMNNSSVSASGGYRSLMGRYNLPQGYMVRNNAGGGFTQTPAMSPPQPQQQNPNMQKSASNTSLPYAGMNPAASASKTSLTSSQGSQSQLSIAQQQAALNAIFQTPSSTTLNNNQPNPAPTPAPAVSPSRDPPPQQSQSSNIPGNLYTSMMGQPDPSRIARWVQSTANAQLSPTQIVPPQDFAMQQNQRQSYAVSSSLENNGTLERRSNNSGGLYDPSFGMSFDGSSTAMGSAMANPSVLQLQIQQGGYGTTPPQMGRSMSQGMSPLDKELAMLDDLQTQMSGDMRNYGM